MPRFCWENISKVAITEENLSSGSKLVLIACVRFVYEWNIFRSQPPASFPKLAVVFKARTSDMDLLHSYTRLQLSKSSPL